MIEFITERGSWNKFMKQIGHFDCYFTYYYHYLSKKEGEKAALVAFSEGETRIALPLLLRDISGTEYRDATSVYGFAGPLSNTRSTEKGTAEYRQFRSELYRFLLEEKIVSLFVRLHPYIDYQDRLLSGLGEISNPGSVVNIDLTLPLDIQRQRYSSRLKTYVNKARRLYSIIDGKEEDYIEKFIELYYENMRRLEADPYYFFDKRYFYQMMISSFFKVELLLCSLTETGEIIGGAMFIKTGNIVQYHLSGCKEEYLHLNPIKLLIDEMRLRATEEGYTYFNLGGGKGVREDSLFRFKALFSKDHRPAKFWKCVINQEVYDWLTAELHEKFPTAASDTDFFPAYRQPIG